jgi:MATE family multidrug resistance protein
MLKFNYQQDFKPLMRLVIPLILTGLVGGLVYFFQTLFLAHIGAKALAAGALVSWLNWLFVVIIFGILGAINILVANHYGAQNFTKICHVVRDGLFLSLILFVPTFFLFWNMSPIFLFLGQKEPIVDLATPYLHALAWGLLPNFLVITLLEMMIGVGNTRVVFFITILSVALTLFFNYVLMFGKWGFPHLGIAGAGWGCTISNFITFTCFLLYLLIDPHYRNYIVHVFHMGKPFYLLELLHIGLPMGLMYCVEVGFFFVLSLKIGSYSHELLAANQIALQYLGVLIGAIFSIAQAITVRMGHLMGAEQYDDAYRTSQAGCLIAFMFILFFSMIECFAPHWLISLDFDTTLPENQLLVTHAKIFLFLCGVFQIFESIRIALFGALRSLKDTHFTLLVSFVTLWVIALPLGLFFEKYYWSYGQGLWIGMIIANILSVFFLEWRLKKTLLNNFR